MNTNYIVHTSTFSSNQGFGGFLLSVPQYAGQCNLLKVDKLIEYSISVDFTVLNLSDNPAKFGVWRDQWTDEVLGESSFGCKLKIDSKTSNIRQAIPETRLLGNRIKRFNLVAQNKLINSYQGDDLDKFCDLDWEINSPDTDSWPVYISCYPALNFFPGKNNELDTKIVINTSLSLTIKYYFE